MRFLKIDFFCQSLLPVVLSPLPPLARRRLLTFHCEEFEEAPESASAKCFVLFSHKII